ncbi:MAG: hypothetical protein JRH20_15320 [Deltaproteobacteria bacterium]|nr:hypothetical protein [Deltaproteobacteria bacterium]
MMDAKGQSDTSHEASGPLPFNAEFDTGYEANEAVGCHWEGSALACGEDSLAHGRLVFFEPQSTDDWTNWDFERAEAMMYVYYEAGAPPTSRSARIIDDPTLAGNRVLELHVTDATIVSDMEGHTKGRVQTNVDIPAPLTELYYRQRVYFHPDLQHLLSYPLDGDPWWLSIMLQEVRAGSPPKDDPYSFLMDTFLVPDFANQNFKLAIMGKKKALGDALWTPVWSSADAETAVPLGEWLTIESAYKQGDASSGRYVIVVWREGAKEPLIVLNRTTWTYNPDSPLPVALNAWNGPQKLYSSDNVFHHIRDQGGAARIYFDDFEVSGSWPAGWVPQDSTATSNEGP